MKKSCVVRLAVFLCLTVLIWDNMADILVNKKRNQYTINNPEAQNADIIFLGSSQGSLGINPQVMWDSQGIMAYNFSGNGQYIGITYYVLQEVLKNFTPQVIALDIFSIVSPGPFRREGNLLYSFTVISDPVLRYQMYHEVIGQENLYFSSLLRYHERWKEITSADFEEATYVMGAELHSNPPSRPEINELPEIPEIQELSIEEQEWEYLKKIVSLAEEHGCKLIFLRMPGESAPLLEGRLQELIQYGEENGIELCDMLSKEFFAESGMQPEDFRDEYHLNVEGADKLSAWLGKYLVENNYVCDRRQEDVAIEWETKVESARRKAWLVHLDMKTNFSDYYEQLIAGDEYEAMLILSGSLPEDMIDKFETIIGHPIEDADTKILWLKDGVLMEDGTITVCGEKYYAISPSVDVYVSNDSGEISINNESAKIVNDGINVIVIDALKGTIVDTEGFDAAKMLP